MKTDTRPAVTAIPTGVPAPRSGASLVEILMSLMVMGIGLVSVVSLFPIAMLRSMQATQMTSAGLLNYQCEDYVRAFPRLVYDDFNAIEYAAVPGNIVSNVEMTNRSPVFSRFGIANVTEYRQSLPLKFVTVVDPIGTSFYTDAGARTYGKDNFGLHTVQNFNFQAVRTNGGFNMANDDQKNIALSMFSSADSWTTAMSSNDISVINASGPTTLQLNDVSTSDMEAFRDAILTMTGRAIVVDRTGKQSHVSQAINVNFGLRQFDLTKNFPDNGMFNVIPEVRLELLEIQYSCLITVRRQLMNLGPGGQPGEDLVDDDGDGTVDNFTEVGWPGTDDEVRTTGANLAVFFRRDFSPLGEQVYEAGNLRAGLNAANGVQQITIRWNGANPDSRPRIQTGGFVFDPVNGYWYKISSVVVAERNSEQPVNAVNTREAVILLDRPPVASGNFLMVPERVVEVFDLPL